MTRRTALWAAVALLGIALSAALAWTASQLATQRVGLSSEPLSVAAGLAPLTAPRNPTTLHQYQNHQRQQAHPSRTPPLAPVPSASTATAAASAPAPAATSPAAAVGSSTPAPATAQPSAVNGQPPPAGAPPVKPRDDSGGNRGSGGAGASGSSDSRQGPDD